MSIINWLVVAASTTLGSFIIFVSLDLIAAVVLAWRGHTFDVHKLGDFLADQFATRKFLGVLGLGVAAAGTAFASTLANGGITQDALLGIAQVALGAMTAGAAAMLASVIKDFYSKVAELFGAAPAPAALPTTPIAVTLVTPEGKPA